MTLMHRAQLWTVLRRPLHRWALGPVASGAREASSRNCGEVVLSGSSRSPEVGRPPPDTAEIMYISTLAYLAKTQQNRGSQTPKIYKLSISWLCALGSKVPQAEMSAANVINDPTQSLQTFDLLDLRQYTQERVYSTAASKDFHLFYVGRDDVHTILKYVLSRVSISLYLNMFGYDDDELNDIFMRLALHPTVTMLVTLDKSQAGGKREKALSDLDRKNLALFNAHVAALDACSGDRDR
jgi:hypothetical protein